MSEDAIDAINPFPKHESGREDRIRRRAHQLWESEGRPTGRDRDHWLAAEREEAADRAVTPIEEPDAASSAPPSSSARAAGGDVPRPESGGPDAAAAVPKTAGAAEPAPDTSRSRVANRDVAGPRKAGATPRPTDKPVV